MGILNEPSTHDENRGTLVPGDRGGEILMTTDCVPLVQKAAEDCVPLVQKAAEGKTSPGIYLVPGMRDELGIKVILQLHHEC